MQYALLLYEDESVYGPDKKGPAFQEIVASTWRFATGSGRHGGAGRG